MTAGQVYDAIIIGASRAAIYLGTALARAGWRTALIERDHLGGTCVNVGCTPTKTMVASARIAFVARRAADYGVHTGLVSVDLAEVRRRKDDLVAMVRSLPERLIEQTQNLDLVAGHARFLAPHIVEVSLNEGGKTTLSAATIVINTGARPFTPPIPGLASVAALDSTSIMELEAVPEHLVVVGGGYVGLEFAQMFRRFGSRVTIVERGPQLLSREDADVAEEVAQILRSEGIDVLLSASTLGAARTDSGIALTVRTLERELSLGGSHLLIAGGRVPNTDGLNLDSTGVRLNDHGLVEVDARLETSVPGIYAIGDVRPGPPFTHAAFDDFRILRANLLERGAATTTARVVPYTVFIDPQLGRIGLTETEARGRGLNIRVAKLPADYPGPTRAREFGETRGLLKVIVDADTAQILGAAILSVEGGELAALLQVAMMGKLPYTALRDAIFTHPTLAEAFNDLFAALDAPAHMPASPGEPMALAH